MIQKRIFENAGETEVEGKVEQCPGLNLCSQFTKRFPNQKGTWKERAEEACAGCDKCDGVIPSEKTTDGDKEVENLFDETARLISLSDCGLSIEWDSKDFALYQLFEFWRKCEKEVQNIRQIRLQSFIKGWFEK